jgi:hypothetical protein
LEDGSAPVFQKWIAGEPNEATRCISYNCSGFQDIPCDTQLLYVCGVKLV